ncbi:MAG: transposase, partial [Actinomycetota bacterium]|nr:transposase [Actinomycetota bacterium]
DYLEWLRWPEGFLCPRCENVGGWRVSDGSFKCARCKAQTAVTVGTTWRPATSGTSLAPQA